MSRNKNSVEQLEKSCESYARSDIHMPTRDNWSVDICRPLTANHRHANALETGQTPPDTSTEDWRTEGLNRGTELHKPRGRNDWLTVKDLRFSRRWLWRMPSSGMLRRVTLVRTKVSEELSASIISVRRIGELGTTLAVTSNRRTLRNVGSYQSHTA
jgi:hypothetical protein